MSLFLIYRSNKRDRGGHFSVSSFLSKEKDLEAYW